MNFQEIIAELKTQDISIEQLAFGDIHNPLLNIGKWDEVDQHGGEGRGEDWWSVKHFSDHDVYVKISGSYASYNGTEFYNGWDDVAEVKPVERIVTFYE